MLNGGTLDGSTISVTSEDVEAPALANVKPVESTAQTPSEKEGHDVEQEDKPRSAVLAEYLAHGYTFSDDIIEKSIAADKRECRTPSAELSDSSLLRCAEYGISSRFLSFFNPLATKVSSAAQPHVERASEKLAQVDEKQGLSLKANAGKRRPNVCSRHSPNPTLYHSRHHRSQILPRRSQLGRRIQGSR